MKILITGASRGIGLAEAKRLSKGNELFLVAENKESFKEKVKNAKYFGHDLSEEDGVADLAKAIKEETKTLDVLINNVGSYVSKKFDQEKWEDVDKMIDLNFRSHVLVTSGLLPLLRKSKNPHIIFMSSAGAKTAVIGESVYSATKAAVTKFADVLRNELTGKIKVTTIHSWGVNTWGAKDAKTLLKPENIAEMVEFIITRDKNFLVESVDLSSINQWREGQAPWSPK